MRSVFLALSASLLLSSCSNQLSVNKPTSDQGNSVPSPAVAPSRAKPTPEAVSVNPAADSIYTDISEKVLRNENLDQTAARYMSPSVRASRDIN